MHPAAKREQPKPQRLEVDDEVSRAPSLPARRGRNFLRPTPKRDTANLGLRPEGAASRTPPRAPPRHTVSLTHASGAATTIPQPAPARARGFGDWSTERHRYRNRRHRSCSVELRLSPLVARSPSPSALRPEERCRRPGKTPYGTSVRGCRR